MKLQFSPINISLLLFCLMLFACSNEQVNRDKYFNEKLTCPEPAIEEFSPWGKSGSQHTCKIKHGPFVAWEEGYVHIRGEFKNGKESGVWYWYDKSGAVTKKIDYSSR